jgi:hypothetical protein
MAVVIVVVVVVVMTTPMIAAEVIARVVVVVLALGATIIVASRCLAAATMFVVAGTRWWRLMGEFVEGSRWDLVTINHTHMPLRESTLTGRELAVVVDGGDGVVVDFFQVDDDPMLAPMLPVLRWCLRHHYGCQGSILCTAGEGQPDLLGDRICCPSP